MCAKSPQFHSRYALPRPVETEEIVAHFYIYGDESGKLGQNEYTSFCGYVGHALEFERAMTEWDACRLAWGVPPLHMRCVMNPDRDATGEWQKVRQKWGSEWEVKRDYMLKEFAEILLQSRLAAVGCVVDSEHFRTMPDSKFRTDMRNPLFLSLFILVMNSIDVIDAVNKTYSIGLVIDDDPQYAKDCYDLLLSLKRDFQRVRDRVTAMTFGNDAAYPALQAADMIAFESRSLMLAKKANPDTEPSPTFVALTRRLIHQPVLYTAQTLDLTAQTYGQHV
jgi:Protein of unknown function (DUF3800)